MKRGTFRYWLVAIAALAIGAQAGWNLRPEYDRLVQAVPYYEPLKNSLYRGLARNDFARAFASDEDLAVLRNELSFLEPLRPRDKVLRLIAWIDENMNSAPIPSVRALELYRARSAAAEVHAFAAGALAAFGVRARWISTAKSSPQFGYLEVFVDGKWELFLIRSGKPDPSLHQSAWDLHRSSEPSLSIKDFWWKPGASWTSWKGTAYPVLLPFANVDDHPELETLFRTDRGIDVAYRWLNPMNYVYGYFPVAEDEWTDDETLMEMFEWHFGTVGMQNAEQDADYINWLGLTKYSD